MPRSAARRHAPRARHAARRARWRRVVTALGVMVAVLLVTGSVSAFVVYQQAQRQHHPGERQQPDRRRPADQGRGPGRPPGAAEHPAARLGRALREGRRERQRRRPALGHHDPAAPRRRPEERRGGEHPARHHGADPELQADRRHRRCRRSTIAMFNSAFSEAGAACTIKTVEKLTNIRIDHHVVVDFGGFKDMVNALGGVKVCVPQDVNDPQSHLVLDQGQPQREGQAGAGLRPHPARAGQRRRHRPDRPPAGVPRLDGHQDQEQGACCSGRTGCCPSSARPPTRSPPTPAWAA